ncbi:ParA family protein [Candidatus Sororendozoicomonas aggregata]|uniref:ParA family protein n=1 Tax=Candidatus Sororendozoicomonas aggregata TaxID=3073239 RepID=UPI002ED2F703
MPKKMAVTNQKGGSGKTTSAVNLSCSLSLMEKSVLLVDLDPQANASKRLGRNEEEYTISNVLTEKKPDINAAIYPACTSEGPIENLFILPASADRELAVTAEQILAKPRREEILSRVLKRCEKELSRFDYIIIDTNPALSVLTMNALLAADEFIIPVNGSADSYDGSWQTLDTVMELHDLEEYEEVNYRILRCDIDRRAPTIVDMTEKLASAHGERKLFSRFIPKSVKYEKSVALNKPIAVLYPNSAEAKDYAAIAKEVVENE